jgi:hypothetical protein
LAFVWNIAVAVGILREALKVMTMAGKFVLFFAMLFAALVPIGILLVNWRAGGAAADILLKTIEKQTGVPMFAFILANNILACVCMTLIVTACCGLMYLPKNQRTSQTIAKKLVEAQLLLYSSAALLFVGVLEIFYLFRWPVSFATETSRASLLELSNSLSLSAGVLYSLLLLVVYVPVGLVHQKWVHEVFAEQSDGPATVNRDEWLKNRGLDTSTLSLFMKVLVIAAPTIGGIVAKFFL